MMEKQLVIDNSTPPVFWATISMWFQMKARSKETLRSLDTLLRKMKPSEFKDNHLLIHKVCILTFLDVFEISHFSIFWLEVTPGLLQSLHWTDLIASSDKSPTDIDLPDQERKRREAVWELFKAECVYLIDHLMVLKHVSSPICPSCMNKHL